MKEYRVPPNGELGQVLSPNQRLNDAINLSSSAQRVKDAITEGADVLKGIEKPIPALASVSSLPLPTYYPPPLLVAAKCNSAEVVDILIRAVIEKSKVYVPRAFGRKKLDPEQTQQALHRNLYDLSENYGSGRENFLQSVAQNNAKRMLATVWPYFKNVRGIDQPFEGGRRLIHDAAGVPENLVYLLEKGADIHGADEAGMTPLMSMCLASPKISHSDLKKLFTIYDQNGADFHAVDKGGRSVIFYALRNPSGDEGRIDYTQTACLDYAIRKGVGPLATDAEGKTAIERLLTFSKLNDHGLAGVFATLADHGYNAPTLIRQYNAASCADAFEYRKKQYRSKLTGPDILDKLWEADQPSSLLIAACGYGLLDAVFEQPALKQNPVRAQELYQKMINTLPPQCQEYLRSGPDISWIRREADRQRRPAAFDGLLKRKGPERSK